MAYTKEDLEKRLAQMIAERGGKSDQIINSSTILGQVRAIQKAHRARAEAVDAEADIYGRSGGDPKPSRSPEPKAAAKKAPAKKSSKTEPKKDAPKAPEEKKDAPKAPEEKKDAPKAPEEKKDAPKAPEKKNVAIDPKRAKAESIDADSDIYAGIQSKHPVYDAISKNGKDSPKTWLNKPLLQLLFGEKGNRTKSEEAEAAPKKRIRGRR